MTNWSSKLAAGWGATAIPKVPLVSRANGTLDGRYMGCSPARSRGCNN